MIRQPFLIRKLIVTALTVPFLLQATGGPRPSFSQEGPQIADTSLIQRKLEWVVSDMGRLLEEMRRIPRLEDRSHLVEDVEDILYRDVEFPLVYQTQARKVVAPSGTRETILPSGFLREAENPTLAGLLAKAYALAGLARSYEGFPAAAQDYLQTATTYQTDVENELVQIDTFGPPRAIREWLAEGGETVREEPVQVTFLGKAVSQRVADRLGRENIHFESTRTDIDYALAVAARDFSKGIRRRLLTDDPITRNRAGWFRLYLPPGPYRIVTGESPEQTSRIVVGATPGKNRFLVETAGEGLTVYSIPHLETYTPRGKTEGAVPSGRPEATGPSGAGGTDATK